MDKKNSIRFILLLGLVSLFADITYEGARSSIGPFLSVLGASGALVGFVAGFGELVGYGFRLISGYISDRTGRYWLMTLIGYSINLFAVPLLAFTNSWEWASVLIILERFGKSIRNPSRDAMLSYASKQTGRGWGFGLHEAMDRIGAMLGPLIMAAALFYKQSFSFAFGILFIPAFCALIVLLMARFTYLNPQDLEKKTADLNPAGFKSSYWLYIIGVSCIAAGYIDFPLIAYHYQKTSVLPAEWIPMVYSLAMLISAASALICGRLYDLKGLSVMIGVTAVSSFFALFAFSQSVAMAIFGIFLWGLGRGAQESIMRAFVANLIPVDKRATAYGILNLFFGVSWFIGSALMGFLYDHSLWTVILFSVISQLAAIPLFWVVRR